MIAAINGELTVKRLQKTPKGIFLVAENSDYAPIELNDSDHIQIWGVVIHAIHAIE